MRLTEKQERFCRAYIETGNASEAYRQSYSDSKMSSKTVNEAASRLLKNSKVAARLDSVRMVAERAVVERIVYDKEMAMDELKEAMQIARTYGQASPFVSAIRLKAELCRLITKQVEAGGPGAFSNRTEEEIQNEIATEVAAIQAEQAIRKAKVG